MFLLVQGNYAHETTSRTGRVAAGSASPHSVGHTWVTAPSREAGSVRPRCPGRAFVPEPHGTEAVGDSSCRPPPARHSTATRRKLTPSLPVKQAYSPWTCGRRGRLLVYCTSRATEVFWGTRLRGDTSAFSSGLITAHRCHLLLKSH